MLGLKITSLFFACAALAQGSIISRDNSISLSSVDISARQVAPLTPRSRSSRKASFRAKLSKGRKGHKGRKQVKPVPEDEEEDEEKDEDEDDQDDEEAVKLHLRPGAKNHRIIVGPDARLRYDQNNITASPGDLVTFEFRQKNHTVTQSSFESPCVGLPTGFKSGFQPVAKGATTFPEFTIEVKDDQPIWGYCGQVDHCRAGMVFSINAPTTGNKTFSDFQFAARVANAGNRSMNDCPAFDIQGNALIGTGLRDDSFTTCEYPVTGRCTYFPLGGLAAGSVQNCPDGLTWLPRPSIGSPRRRHRILVGANGKLEYTNSSIKAFQGAINATNGDIVTFEFRQKNHTATVSSFETPCVGAVGGQKSGFQFVAENVTTGFPEFSITITNSSVPIWGYCGQTGHCAAGMVFAINAPATGDRTFEKYRQRAIASNGTTTGPTNARGALAGLSDDEQAADEKALLRNSYILLGLAGGVILLLITVIVLIVRGGGRAKPSKSYAPVTLPRKDGSDEGFSLTHPQGETARYGD